VKDAPGPVASTACIEVTALSKGFAASSAVDNLSFSVARGEIFGLVGPDGAGKTTIMRMLAGVMRPDAGSIMIDDVDVIAAPERAKRHLSYMPQRFGLYEDLTVDENIRFFADLFGIDARMREDRSARLLAASGMTPFRRRLAGQLSGGMKQKLGLICSLIHTPRVLLLDEPTTGVDPVSRREFWAILYSLREDGVTIVISTSYLDEAERCGRLALLHAGRLFQCDTPDALKQRLQGAIVAVATTAPREAKAALDGVEGIASVLLVGGGLHVMVDDAVRRVPELRARLMACGIAIEEVASVTPSVEDLFVAFLQDDRKAA
jgi:ABC-2 type transport system ATP-binding protein